MTGCIKKNMLGRIVCFVGMLAWTGSDVQAFEGYSDPLKPSAADEISATPSVPFFQIPARLKQVEQGIEQETQVLTELAPLQLGMQFDSFGYHSDYIPIVEGVPDEPLWSLTFSGGAFPTLGFVMVPALDQRSSDLKGYAFPKRFRICSVDEQGQVDKVYVDWTMQDFPDPGLRPVYFALPLEDAPIAPLRLEVFAGHEENGLEFFALGRIHQMRQGELQKVNLQEVSSSFDSAPYWTGGYLGSPRQTLGMPLSAKKGEGGNLLLKLPAAKLNKPLVIRVELDSTEELGWVNLFPGQSAGGIDVPGYGFPNTMNIYRVVQNSEGGAEKRFPLEDQHLLKNPGNNMVRLAGRGVSITALEIECNDFPVYQGQAVFALGEVEVFIRGRNLSRGRDVHIRGYDQDVQTALVMLVDGKVGGRNILPLPEWLQQLAAGKPHESRLEAMEAEKLFLTERWIQVRTVLQTSLGVLAMTGVLVFVFFMLRSRKLVQARLRRQISCDLHDDVGSSLGCISLTAEQLKHADVNEDVQEELCDLALMAREAWASLREVVWVIDEESIRLPALLQRLRERAERVLGGVEVSVEVSEECPDCVVTLTFKRHLIMYFKEVVHNCARHACASRVWLGFRVVDGSLEVSVRDNGCGFDLTQPSTGLGLESIHNRAREMEGRLELDSAPGKGTSVVLRVPLKSLLNRSDHSYKTSN
ncbi:histidine kinase [Pontiellaceae bacterium B1224]|nr:histidine kinase [Pontiellaceae bacterium B1224]